MEKSLNVARNLVKQWDALRAAKPGETEFSQFGYEGLRHLTFDDLFREWVGSLEQVENKSKWLERSQAQIADVVLDKWLTDLVGLVAQAQGHGVAWLLTTGFFQRIGEISNLLAVTIDRKVNVARQIAKDFEHEAIDGLKAVSAAAPIANEIIAKKNDVNLAAERVSNAAEESETSYAELKAAAEKLQQLYGEVTDAHASATEVSGDATELHAEITKIRDQAETKASELETRIVELNRSVEESTKTSVETLTRLNRVLVDARKQGLAGAFSERGRKLLNERIGWGVVFVLALISLAVVSISFATELVKLDIEALSVALLRRVALAAPLVWLGWFAAKQLGRLGRLQEDYEYKAATAVAFQSYKSEVESSGDEELVRELLMKTITTFGENPVRLYEHHSKDPATPTEELLNLLEKDKTFSLVKKLLDLGRTP